MCSRLVGRDWRRGDSTPLKLQPRPALCSTVLGVWDAERSPSLDDGCLGGIDAAQVASSSSSPSRVHRPKLQRLRATEAGLTDAVNGSMELPASA